MQDHYETLQVHPKADQEAIQAAYERLRQRHDPAKLEGAAEELVELAQHKREAIEHAYAVLGDTTRRAAYDAERQEQQAQAALSQQQSSDQGAALDYRPLPPAGGKERPQGFHTSPRQSAPSAAATSGRQARQKLPPWAIPAAVVAALTFVIIFSSLLLTDGGQPRYAAEGVTGANAAPGQEQAPPDGQEAAAESQISPAVYEEYDGQVTQARQVTNELPNNVNAWINMGNALYDSVQIVREQEPDSETYAERVPRWLEASEAYGQALELGIEDPLTQAIVRSDMGVSLCYYSTDTGEPDYAQQGIEYTRQAIELNNENGRVLLNHGICLVSIPAPRTAEALELWQTVVDLPATQIGIARQAQRLIEEYSQ